MAIELTPQLTQALDFMEESQQHVFITGKAGTGKSTLLNHFKETTQKNVAVVAPTGVAALNVGGQTVHSFFKFRLDVTPESAGKSRLSADQAKLYKSLDTLVIDEVSMLRADLLDCIDRFLRRFGPRKNYPFGGVQMVFIGDLYQLPPVVTGRDQELFQGRYKGPYFFDALVIDTISLYLVELDKIYRQSDTQFIELLNAIRENTAGPDHLDELNRRRAEIHDAEAVYLTTTNELADRINQQQLERLTGEPLTSTALVTGSFSERDFPTSQILTLRPGAQVMTLTNESGGAWVNGSIGQITSVREEEGKEPIVEVRLTNGKTVGVRPFTWELYRYQFNAEEETVEPEVVGTFRQYPLRLAWAITIHKSQGKTFDRTTIDLGRGTFSPGQLYVALSRCRSLDGITLRQPILPRHIMSNPRIGQFMGSFKDGLRQVGQGDLFGEW